LIDALNNYGKESIIITEEALSALIFLIS